MGLTVPGELQKAFIGFRGVMELAAERSLEGNAARFVRAEADNDRLRGERRENLPRVTHAIVKKRGSGHCGLQVQFAAVA